MTISKEEGINIKYIKVTDSLIKFSKEMAEDLYGLACINDDIENKKKMRLHIKKCESYLKKQID